MLHPNLLPRFLRALSVFIIIAALAPTHPARAASVIYVVPGGAGTQTGADWRNAKDLQAALLGATSGDQIWVKAGTYKPTTSGDRTATFQLKSGVALFGGFAGAETDLSQRDPATHISILSGDLLSNDSGAVASSNPTRSDNSYHVVTGSGTDATAVLDGFTITSGNANSGSIETRSGGGLLNAKGQPTLRNLILYNNSAFQAGGGMFNYLSSNPSLHNSSFLNNTAGDDGGGLSNAGNSSITLSRVIFRNNSAPYGGGIFSEYSDLILNYALFQGNQANLVGGGIVSNYGHTTIAQTIFSGNTSESFGSSVANYQNNANISQVTFSENWSKNNGGALVNEESSPLIRNSIFWGNQGGQIYNYLANNTPDVQYSLVQGDYISGTHILTTDPLFVDADGADNIAGTPDDDLRPQAGSPAIDAGYNAFIPSDLTDDNNNNNVNETAPFDLDRNPRLDGAVVDLGPFESQLHPHFTSPLPPAGTYGSSYSHTFTASALAPVTYSITAGSLPPGLALNTATGLLSGTSTAAGNYSGITVTASNAAGSADQTFALVIQPKALTIAADNKTRAFGVPNPPLTASYSGFVNGDTPAGLDVPVSLITTAAIASPPGSYPITASGAADANYEITLQNGSLRIIGVRAYLALIGR